MSEYRADRNWADRFIPEIKSIVGPLLLSETSLEVDRKEAADLIVMSAERVTIACRVRKFGYAINYGNQFTIRYKRDSGAKTEFAKIKEGFGNWMFYGHADRNGSHLERWMLIDLASFRTHLTNNRSIIRDEPGAWGKMSNGDGTYFIWFDVTKFPSIPPLVIASSVEDVCPV